MAAETAHDVDAATRTSILVVCTGNLCRSPALERLLRSAFGPTSGITVSSAGTEAVVGQSINPPMAELMEQAGLDTSDFEARLLTPQIVRQADLVVGFTRAHRSAAVLQHPAAVRHAYTFLELARMLDAVDARDVDEKVGHIALPAERLAAALPLADAHRLTPARGEAGEVEDPMGQGHDVYARVFDQIRDRARPYVRAALR